ncbi:hypothetical protein MRS44_000521 [Fusarium solani]|uniref:Uncharacterized protein n=1 Tax=Fusarium solani TaxID=169388 RepID=A0A9P9RCK3_FUSSL|nr:uncharacterized protein B0J15DRAFT_385025 [Fusarium solani]KAH7274626.1 hypothetical protein B0J15DRAFT_385025 [Fusarium solani]KAJ3470422.1 hypothetical protein MRS44_000521 [Fusarium solani]
MPGEIGKGKGGFRPGMAPAPRTTKHNSFANTKGDHMPTAKSIFQTWGNQARQAEYDEFLGPAPADKHLIQLTHVIPGKHLLPPELDEPGALDGIRRQYGVYITRVKPNVLDLRCESIGRLQEALRAINWALRDMRLSNEHASVRFLVQRPTNAIISDMISVELGKRPAFLSPSPSLVSNMSSMNDHLPQLASDMAISAEGLMGVSKNMTFRINFGHLTIGKKKKGSEDEVSIGNFTKLMDMYSVRGGASFEPRLPNAERAEKILQFLVKAEQHVCRALKDVERTCEFTVVTEDQEIKANANCIPGQNMKLSMVRATRPEAWGRLNWTVVAPDMLYDWNFRVDAWDKVDVATGFKDLAQKVCLTANVNKEALLAVPTVNTAKLAALEDEIKQIRVKSAARFPYKDSSYVLEISVTKTVNGFRAAGGPEVTWSVELYAPHWEESVNHMSGGRKVWGEGLENIWTDEGHDLKSRLGGFCRVILEVQALLSRADASAASQ